MVEIFNTIIKKESVIASPNDEILEGVIISIQKGELKEFLDEAVHHKFDNLNQETLQIGFEVDFKDKKIKGNDKLAYYEEPMTNSKLGKFLTKYNELKTGISIKVIYDSNGFGKIKVD